MSFIENGEEYYSIREACNYLNVTRQTLDSYVERGLLTKYRRTIARRVFFKKSQLTALLSIR